MTISTSHPQQAVIYCRVSGAKQVREGDGLASQETRCREYAGFKGYEVVQVFNDDITGKLAAADLIDTSELTLDSPFDFLLAPDIASSVTEAAYRFCRHEPGAHVILTGTGSLEHLKENLNVLQMPPLPKQAQDKLRKIFGKVDSVSGN